MVLDLCGIDIERFHTGKGWIIGSVRSAHGQESVQICSADALKTITNPVHLEPLRETCKAI